MKKALIVIIVLIIAGVGIYYIFTINKNLGSNLRGNTDNQKISDIQATAAPKASSKTDPSDMTINIGNLSFIPSVLTIRTGTKVTWVNSDTVPHTVTSDTANLFDSGTLLFGQSFSYTFTNTGSFGYHCNIHKIMRGIVVVVAGK